MTAPDRRWTDADRVPVVRALSQFEIDTWTIAVATDAVLDALTAAGWRREADVRAEVVEEIAEDFLRPHHDAFLSQVQAVAIARAHRTTPGADRV